MASKVCLAPCPEKKTLAASLSLSFYSSPNKQKTEHQSESNSATS
jgi:hypothetical protein